jgi:hypothetical protein
MVKCLCCVMMGLGSNGYFLTGTPCLNEGHGCCFANIVGHPRLDSIGLLVCDSMHTYLGHRCCITGPLGQCQPCREGVNILGRPSWIELWLNSYYKHVLYLYCMHYHLVKWNDTPTHVIYNLNWVHQMITYHAYYYSLSLGLTLVSFHLWNMYCFIDSFFFFGDFGAVDNLAGGSAQDHLWGVRSLLAGTDVERS